MSAETWDGFQSSDQNVSREIKPALMGAGKPNPDKQTQIFHLTLEGLDTDFGPSSSTSVKITIEGDLYWGKEEIQECKEMIASYFEVFPNHVRTDAEEQKDAEDLGKYIKEETAKFNQ